MNTTTTDHSRMVGHATAWQHALRLILPQLPASGVAALRIALRHNDSRILQGGTTRPTATHASRLVPVDAADPIAYALWRGRGLRTVGQVEDAWHELVSTTIGLCATRGGSVFDLIRWWEETPRAEAVAQLLRELDRWTGAT